MSGQGFHVHGPHDHAVEEASGGHHGSGSSNRLAMATAILATVGAIFSYMGGSTQSNAAMYKNDAAILKTEASNKWNYYQAKSQKENLANLATMILPEGEKVGKQQAEVERYKAEKEEIKKEAQAIEEQVKHKDELSEHEIHKHHRWALATTVLQIAIALAAIALIAQKKWLEIAMGLSSTIGLGIGVSALFM